MTILALTKPHKREVNSYSPKVETTTPNIRKLLLLYYLKRPNKFAKESCWKLEPWN